LSQCLIFIIPEFLVNKININETAEVHKTKKYSYYLSQ